MLKLEEMDRRVINGLQGGFPISDRPFAAAASEMKIDEATLIEQIRHLVETGAVSRFGPLWNSEELGGAVCLAAMSVPPNRFESVADLVNAHPEVAHNYERTHQLNMWFVLSSLDPKRIAAAAKEIEAETGLIVYLMPKEKEYFVGLKIEV